MLNFKSTFFIFVLVLSSCGNPTSKPSVKAEMTFVKTDVAVPKATIVAANKVQDYLPLLKGKKVGIVANQTSVLFKSDSLYTHIVDSLLALNVQITKVFAPEHGF